MAATQVDLRNLQDDALVISKLTTFARSDESGRYLFAGVPPGQYIVAATPDEFFSYPENSDLLGAFYGDTRLSTEADLVTVTEANLDNPLNSITGIVIHLPVGATIRGTVIDAATQTPLENVTINVSQTLNSELIRGGLSIRTDASGVYTATGLQDSAAQVSFMGATEYLHQVYDKIDTPSFQGGGELIELALGETVTGIDAELNKASRLSGRVVDPEGNPINDVSVRLESVADPSVDYDTFTNANGEYSRLVLPGQYTVRFSRNIICGCYNREYYTTADDPQQPTAVTVGALAEVADINITLECGSAPPLVDPRDSLFMPKLTKP